MAGGPPSPPAEAGTGTLAAAVSLRVPSTARRLLATLGAGALVLGFSACGTKVGHPTFANSDATASSGFYVDAGPITYQVQVSRQLNPYATEDKNYLIGVPPTIAAPTSGQMWFAVFVWAKNQSHRAHKTTDTFTITDTQNNSYRPIAINSAINPLAWTPQTLAPGGTEPGPGSAASDDPVQGSELLFKVEDSVYINRPLTLNIVAPGAGTAKVQLDL